MKLSEIFNAASMTSNTASITISKEQIENAEELGPMAHGFEVYKVKNIIDNLVIFFCKDTEGKIIGQFGFQKITICGITGYLGRRAFINTAFAGKGYGTDFYTFIWKYLKTPLFSDESQTPAGRALWRSLSKRHDVKVLNTNSGEILSRKDIPDTIIYTNNENNSADYLLMLEAKRSSVFIKEDTPEFRRIITPYASYEDGDY